MGGLDCSTAACPDQCVQPVKSSEIDTACRCHVAQTGNLACLSDLRVLEVCAENPPRKFCSPIASTPTGLWPRVVDCPQWQLVKVASEIDTCLAVPPCSRTSMCLGCPSVHCVSLKLQLKTHPPKLCQLPIASI